MPTIDDQVVYGTLSLQASAQITGSNPWLSSLLCRHHARANGCTKVEEIYSLNHFGVSWYEIT